MARRTSRRRTSRRLGKSGGSVGLWLIYRSPKGKIGLQRYGSYPQRIGWHTSVEVDAAEARANKSLRSWRRRHRGYRVLDMYVGKPKKRSVTEALSWLRKRGRLRR